MVSVIVLTYNHEKYIRQALDSILMQKVDFKYEILVGDDCSTDGTSQIVQQYAEKYPDSIIPLIRETNIGPSRNLYEVLKYAKGKYIAFCEGDDFWSNVYKLQKQYTYLEDKRSAIACTHAFQTVNENGEPIEKTLSWISNKSIFTLSDFKGYILPGQLGTLMCRNVFQDSNHSYEVIYQAHAFVSDRTLVFILLLYGDVHRLANSMSCYRITQEGTNATAVMFEKNKNVNLLQYQLTKKLEKYAQSEFGINVHFNRFKAEQYLKYMIKKLIRWR